MRKEETFTSCDMCGEPGKPWTLSNPVGDRYYVDLCHRHGKELHVLCDAGTPAKKGPFGTRAAKLKAQENEKTD